MATLSKKVDALVVGAGPVGLFAALKLARAGLEVEIIDRAWRSSAQSYACGLHSETVDLLASAGLEEAVLESGLRVETVGFYEGPERRGELRLTDSGTRYPFLLVVPQDRVEELLEEALRREGIRVHWGHRLDRLRTGTDSVTATVEKLALTSVGYPYARSEEMVQSSREVQAGFVVGADGAHSHVREILGIPVERVGGPWNYEVVEFDGTGPSVREVRICLGSGMTDVFWPQQGSTCRWSLELPVTGDTVLEYPEKERRSIVVLDDEPDAQARDVLLAQLRSRAPWFESGIREIDWRATVSFQPQMAGVFGRDRCWLAGDAGHQTSPVGMQSMNVGLREAADLAERMASILRQGGNDKLLEAYDASRRNEWRTLLGGGTVVSANPNASAWAKDQRKRVLPWIPGSGAALEAYLGQLGLVLAPA